MAQNQKINQEVTGPESTPVTPLVTIERPNCSAPGERTRPMGHQFSGEEARTSSGKGRSVHRRSTSCWFWGRTVPKADASLPPGLDQPQSLCPVNHPYSKHLLCDLES